MRASWLTSRSHAAWMESAGIIRNHKVVEGNVMICFSKQCPKGYEVCRVEAEVLEPEHCKPQFNEGDRGYELQGYHNDWRLVAEQDKGDTK